MAVSLGTATEQMKNPAHTHTIKNETSTGSAARIADAEQLDRDIHELSLALQRSLDPVEIMHVFAEKISQAVNFSSFSYRHEEKHYELTSGNRSLHSCAYNLNVAEHELGEISFTRRKPFSEDELTLFEMLLTHLVYPLRNAILYQEALQCALQDALTGVGNRRAMEQAINREIKLSDRLDTPLSVLLLDIDHFKAINDTYGHKMGDQALIAFAECTKECIRSSDMLFRFGGEEFAVIMSNTDLQGAHHIAERIRETVENFTMPDSDLRFTVSIGISELPCGDDYQGLVECADEALYKAKEDGRNCVRVNYLNSRN